MKTIYNAILCLGDSLTYGARDEYLRGYPAELSSLLNKKSDQFWVVINEGVNGNRSGDLLRRLPKIIGAYPEAYTILLQIGTNDTLELIPKEIFKDNLFQIIKTCQIFRPVPGNRKIILGSLISLQGLGLMSYSKKGAILLREYDLILKDISNELDIPLVNLVPLEKFRVDRCHLNNQGYKEMAKLFLKEIENL